MIRHIIMFKFIEINNEEDRFQFLKQMKTSFLPLKNSIDVVKSYEMAINQKKTNFSYDLALISEFDTWSDLEKYIQHPEHQKAIEACKNIKKEKAVIDYEF